jgi:hypothetical protein
MNFFLSDTKQGRALTMIMEPQTLSGSDKTLSDDDRHLEMEGRETASVADGAVHAEVVVGSQVVEGQDNIDGNPSVETGNFDGALSESSEATAMPLQPAAYRSMTTGEIAVALPSVQHHWLSWKHHARIRGTESTKAR